MNYLLKINFASQNISLNLTSGNETEQVRVLHTFNRVIR